MGWSGAGDIFDPVAQALINLGALDEIKTRVLTPLIKGLQDGDWDTEDESLEHFLTDRAVIQAFAANDVHLSDRRCCRAALADDPRAALLAMRSDDVDEPEMTVTLDAYTHQLAEQLRTDANLRATEGERELATYGRELADLIDRTTKED